MRLINADSVLEGIEELKKSPWYNEETGKPYRQDAVAVIRDVVIRKEPTVAAAPVIMAEWQDAVKKENGKRVLWNMCSACRWLRRGRTPYCPNCGAKMRNTPCLKA